MSKNASVSLVLKWFSHFLLLFALLNPAFAEDTEIFHDEIPPSKPNIMFLLDQSGSMGINVSGTSQTRLDALRSAFNSVMSDPGLVDVNVGLMGFSNGRSTPYPHGVSFPISPIDAPATPLMLSNLIPFGSTSDTIVGYFTLDDDTLPNPVADEAVREFLPRILTGWDAWGSTPIVDAYYEAALYFRGERPKWGLATPEQNHAAHPSTYRGSSQGTISQVLTGNTAVCAAPECGINCVAFTEQATCSVDQTTCGLGTNCTTTTESWGENCTLGSEAECLASDPKFTSCTASSSSSCSSSCISGVYHPETGACIPDALNSFTIKTHGASNSCVEVNGTAVTQEVCTGASNQIFYSTEARTGFIKIHTSNEMCLDITGSSTENDATVIAHDCTSAISGSQVFQQINNTIVADHSGKCFDIPAAQTTTGVSLIQYGCHGGTNQIFTLSNHATSCSTTNNILCQYPQETTRCDHQKYRCDETAQSVTLDSTDIIYNSPIKEKCETNAIVLLSDGDPYVPDRTQYNQTMSDIKTLTGMVADCEGTDDGRCGTELAKFLSTQDQSATVDGDNLINTYTIGFDVATGSTAETFLTSVAKAGGGNYFPASNAAVLASVFKAIISDVSKTARSYAAPVYTVDPSSRLAHSRDIYIPLFENSAAPRWSGNLKKFKLNDKGQIIDRTGKVAVSSEGILDPKAQDFWTPADTPLRDKPNPVTAGGAANLLNPANRKLLTDNGSSLVNMDLNSVSKTALAKSGSIADALHQPLLKFIQGYEEDGTSRNHIGDILHSKPMVVSYSNKEVIFFGTNEGYLHAINTADAGTVGGGEELFAFMPAVLLSNIQGQYENNPLTGSIKRIYGVDGEMTVWIKDNNKNGKVDTGSGDKAYLFFGLRRGGHAYYALDITDPSNPSLLWTINNGQSQFSQLGETWSKPTMGKLRYLDSGTVKFEEVLVFGGGYDAAVYDEENPAARQTGTVTGNGVYIVSAITGRLIWSYVDGDLKDSVPSSIRVLDVDRNGSIDRLYFGDTGGNVWRVDLNVDDYDDDASANDVKKDAKIYKFASLGANGGSDARKFFSEPDVSLFKHKGRFVSLITIGSGYRAHPNNTNIADRLFVLYDENAMSIPRTAPPAITDTGNDLAPSSALAGADFLPVYKGWYKDLTNGVGEKSLSSPLVFRNKVMFTTFGLNNTPTSTGGAGSCTTKTNNFNRAYALDLMTGSATVDLDGDGQVTDKDESVTIGFGEIPDSPKLVFNKPSNCTNDGCDHNVDVRVGKLETPLIDKDTVDGNVNLGDYLPSVFWVDSPQ